MRRLFGRRPGLWHLPCRIYCFWFRVAPVLGTRENLLRVTLQGRHGIGKSMFQYEIMIYSTNTAAVWATP